MTLDRQNMSNMEHDLHISFLSLWLHSFKFTFAWTVLQILSRKVINLKRRYGLNSRQGGHKAKMNIRKIELATAWEGAHFRESEMIYPSLSFLRPLFISAPNLHSFEIKWNRCTNDVFHQNPLEISPTSLQPDLNFNTCKFYTSSFHTNSFWSSSLLFCFESHHHFYLM